MQSQSLVPAIPQFDMLVALHQHDREAFEALRVHLLRDAVDAAPAEQRPSLINLLSRIEAARASAATDEQAACVAFGMMAQSLKQLRLSWNQVCESLGELQTRLLIEKVR